MCCLYVCLSVLLGPLRAPAATRPPDGSSSRKEDRPGHTPGPATKRVEVHTTVQGQRRLKAGEQPRASAKRGGQSGCVPPLPPTPFPGEPNSFVARQGVLGASAGVLSALGSTHSSSPGTLGSAEPAMPSLPASVATRSATNVKTRMATMFSCATSLGYGSKAFELNNKHALH